jgi:hypothetical protein
MKDEKIGFRSLLTGFRPEMKRWVWAIALALLILIGSCGIETRPSAVPEVSPEKSPTTAIAPPIAKPSPVPKVVIPVPVPQVSAEELQRHVRGLSGERYGEDDRAQVRAYLTETLSTLGWKPELQNFEGGINVIARRPGSDPGAGRILLTAHYDTVPGSPGADDNASAIAVALETARLLGNRPTPCNLELAFFDLEERGLLGSLAFTAEPANLSQLLGVINLEMLGYACYTPGCQKYPENLPIATLPDRGDFIGVVGDQEHLPLLNAFQTAAKSDLPSVITLPVPFKGLLTPDVLRSDHAPFWAKNIGAVMVGDTANFRNPHYHQPSDTPDTLDLSFLTGSAQLVVNATSALLESQESLLTTGDR